MCEVALDSNHTLIDETLKNLTWSNEYSFKYSRISVNTEFKRLNMTVKNLIIVKIKYKNPIVEMTVLDARTTLSDKIANFGGTFGIWAELTGISLLGIINFFVIFIKCISACFCKPKQRIV